MWLHYATRNPGNGSRKGKKQMIPLLKLAIEAHGGLSRWREIEAFRLKVSIGGGLWRLKGLPDGLRDVTLRIQAHRPIVTITPFGGKARTGHFTPDRVWVEDANGGVVEERTTPRASFAGHVLTTPWINCRNSTSWATHCGTTLRLRSCSPNPASRPVRSGHTRKTARRGTASSSSTPKHPDPLCRAGLVFQRARITPAYGLLRGCGRRHGRRCRLSLLLRSYPVRWHRHSDPPPAVSRTPKGAVLSGPTGVLLQMSDIKPIPNAPKEKNNDR